MILDFLKKVYQIWISERPTQLAAALAYYAMFSIAPVIFIAFSVAGVLLKNIAPTERVFEHLNKFFTQFGIFISASAAAGSVAMLLIISYYMAQIFLLGAVTTRVYSNSPAEKTIS
jgi:uncharacterized BrkB/YihY/UPF0761 family membrane protein